MPGNNTVVTITGLSHEGRGIGQIEGKTVFIENALPNEVIEIEITKKHSRYNEARILNIIESSPDRVEPKCSHFHICGGCQLQHMDINAQINLKQKTLLEQLKYTGHVEPEEILTPLHSPSWGYRYKGRLSVKFVEKKQKLLIGFHEKNGRFVADLSQCEVLDPRIGLSIELLRQFILSLSLFRQLPQIEIACDESHCALIFRCLQDLTEQDKKLFIQFGQENNFWIYIEPNKPEKLTQLWPLNEPSELSYTLRLNPHSRSPLRHFRESGNSEDEMDPHFRGDDGSGRDHGIGKNKNIKFNFHPKDFTQINPNINQQMVNLALELLSLEPTDQVLDLFCGLGNFTLPIAQHCGHVTGIEGDKNMILRAQHNAQQNHILNTEFHAVNLFEPDKINSAWIEKKYNKILLDPPRTGAIEILPYMKKWKPELIVYVSCNPATLARDAGELVNTYGYTLKKAGMMDMFPHTKHTESIALFTRV